MQNRDLHLNQHDHPDDFRRKVLNSLLDDMVFLVRPLGANRMSDYLVELANSIQKRGLYDDVSRDSVLRIVTASTAQSRSFSLVRTFTAPD